MPRSLHSFPTRRSSDLVNGGTSGFMGAMLIIVAFIIFPLSYTIFTLFNALYGSVLYVVGPFVLALMPARGFGQLAKTRSEEHTSELQSLTNLVCRLLLE